MDPDFLLIQRMKYGDEAAIEEFVRKYYPEILRYCLLRVDDAGYAGDAVQETFERFFRNFDRYRHCGKAANYLYVIAGNVCRDYYRGRRETAAGDAETVLQKGRKAGQTDCRARDQAGGDDGGQTDCRARDQTGGDCGGQPEAEQRAAEQARPETDLDLRMDIRDAFRALPEELREAAILFFCQERTQREIGDILGIGLPLVKYRIRKAREMLRELLKEVY